MIGIRLPRFLVLALILLFWANGLSYLDRFPPVHEDEPWIAAPGYTFWEKGYFGTDLFAGFFGMERHYYTFPPLFSLMVGGGLHWFGMGLFQARIIPLCCLTLVLALIYRIGAAGFSRWHGVIAVAVLVGWRVAGPDSSLFSGIPLADLARIARYDSAVPLFGLAALWLSSAALRRPSPRKWSGVGVLTALATLCHLYGGFWLAALLLLVLGYFRQCALKPTLFILLGFGLTLLPWLLFIASGWHDYLAQNRIITGRFNLFDPQFYLANLAGEVGRYQPLLDMMGYSWGARLWLALLTIGLIGLARRGRHSARNLLIIGGTMVGLFALFSPVKTFSYLATLWPLFALVVACGAISLWRFTPQRAWKMILILLFTVVMLEGGGAIQRARGLAAQITPYWAYTDGIARWLPPDSRVLGLQHYWFGLEALTASYRSILVPIYWTNPTYVATPIPFGDAADMIPSDILLLDQHMLDLLRETATPDSPLHNLAVQIDRYLREHDAHLIGNVGDPTYGQTLIYQLK